MSRQLGVLIILLFLPFYGFASENARFGINGGVNCFLCTLLVGVAGQVAEIKNTTILEEARKICEIYPFELSLLCDIVFVALNVEYGRQFRALSKEITPDVVCYAMNLCHVDPGRKRCHLFPPPDNIESVLRQFESLPDHPLGNFNLCEVLFFKRLCEYLKPFFGEMKPLYDEDKDMFSYGKYERGTHWRGKDCDDSNSNVHPGRKPYLEDVHVDANCNGISGVNKSSGIPWETAMCESQKNGSRGIIFLGDSMGAHMRIPEEWINPLHISEGAVQNFSLLLKDQFDWPEIGFTTGYDNSSDFVKGSRFSSLYLQLRNRNLCNHRDYQNICRNGAKSSDMASFVDDIARSDNDKPALVIIGVFGNDVCNRFNETLQHMTPPDEFRSNIRKALDKLSHRLPMGSHVVLVGLADGGFIYEALSERLHPIGALHRNVKYKDLYKWYECLEMNPCSGWLIDDPKLRKATSEAANTLSQVLKDLADTTRYEKFELHYINDPFIHATKLHKDGGDLWEFIDPVDGFHPSQKAQPLLAFAIWTSLLQVAPQSLGIQNPNNEWIKEVFGDQGGH